MRLFGLNITKAAVPATTIPQGWINGGPSWYPIVREPFTGAWQRNMEQRTESVITYSAVFACITLIASDVGKNRIKLVEQDSNDIWSEVDVPAFSPVLRRPNRYQNRIKFVEQWVTSKLIYGNTYVLKERDQRGVVVALYILDPGRVTPTVAPDGSVYYQLKSDNLAGIEDQGTSVPASDIIHDTMVAMYHPLCGVSPITACGLAAAQGLAIQRNSNTFFANGSRPGGILTAPGEISQPTADRLKADWQENFTGNNAGKVAVLGDGLKYESMTITAVDSQLIEQLKWSAETVCSVFHVPPYMIGVGSMPSYNNIEALNQQYYAQCLQSIIENLELCLDEGLGLTTVQGHVYGTEFDLEGLLRMDTATKVKSVADSISAGFLTPNEGRFKFNLKPVKGGDTPYLQQQNYSLAALDKRDRADNPFAPNSPPPAPSEPTDGGSSPDQVQASGVVAAWKLRSLLLEEPRDDDQAAGIL